MLHPWSLRFFSIAGWGRENPGKKKQNTYLHVIFFDMFLLISCPAFLAPWCPPSTYWWGSCLYGNALQRLASQWDVFSQGAAGLAMATIINPAWGIKTQSCKDSLMDLGLFYQLHLAMLFGDLSWMELPLFPGKNGEENILPCLLLMSKILSFASPFLHHFLFLF